MEYRYTLLVCMTGICLTARLAAQNDITPAHPAPFSGEVSTSLPDSEPAEKTRIHRQLTLDEAMKRIKAAKNQLRKDQQLLERLRPRLPLETYEIKADQLTKREKLIRKRESVIQEYYNQLVQDQQQKRSTGEKFYEQQSDFYRPIYESDVDLSLH